MYGKLRKRFVIAQFLGLFTSCPPNNVNCELPSCTYRMNRLSPWSQLSKQAYVALAGIALARQEAHTLTAKILVIVEGRLARAVYMYIFTMHQASHPCESYCPKAFTHL